MNNLSPDSWAAGTTTGGVRSAKSPKALPRSWSVPRSPYVAEHGLIWGHCGFNTPDDPSVVCCPFWTFFDCHPPTTTKQQFPEYSIAKTTSHTDDISLPEEPLVALSAKTTLEAVLH